MTLGHGSECGNASFGMLGLYFKNEMESRGSSGFSTRKFETQICWICIYHDSFLPLPSSHPSLGLLFQSENRNQCVVHSLGSDLINDDHQPKDVHNIYLLVSPIATPRKKSQSFPIRLSALHFTRSLSGGTLFEDVLDIHTTFVEAHIQPTLSRSRYMTVDFMGMDRRHGQ